MRAQSYSAVVRIAMAYWPQTVDGPFVAQILNGWGITRDDGQPYSGGRRIYRVFSCAYKEAMKRGLPGIADRIAETFVNPNGNWCWQ